MDPTWWEPLSECDGKRLSHMTDMGVPLGWVVDGTLPAEVRDKIKAHAIPLKPGGWHLISRWQALVHMRVVKRDFGDAIMVVVPSDETQTGYFASAVLIADLEKNPNDLLREALKTKGRKKWFVQRMKECAYMAVTGQRDLK